MDCDYEGSGNLDHVYDLQLLRDALMQVAKVCPQMVQNVELVGDRLEAFREPTAYGCWLNNQHVEHDWSAFYLEGCIICEAECGWVHEDGTMVSRGDEVSETATTP